ncbi:hypothetical protein BS78_05G268300 [Paspalum vaginatum]|nr:hypothetical protein BS78_05G268300 [Paspalum vaginatum]
MPSMCLVFSSCSCMPRNSAAGPHVIRSPTRDSPSPRRRLPSLNGQPARPRSGGDTACAAHPSGGRVQGGAASPGTGPRGLDRCTATTAVHPAVAVGPGGVPRRLVPVVAS